MNIKLDRKKTDDELDMEALEKDIFLFDYLDRIEKDLLSDKEKKEREDFYKALGFMIKK